MNADAMFAEMRSQPRAGGKGLEAIQAVIMVLFLELAKRVMAVGVGREMHLLLDGGPIVKRRGSGRR